MASRLLHWACNNKLLLFFVTATICLSISTLSLALQKNTSDIMNYKMKERKLKMDIIKEDNYYRLPANVVPINYKLKLWPNLINRTFQGTVAILIRVLEPTNTITLHTKHLDITSADLKDGDISIHVTTNTSIYDRELLRVELQNDLNKSNYTLILSFSGRLDKGIVGFYASALRNGGTMVASKFQPTYARQAFPCFDEPDFKATYDITLVKPISYVALSNMNEVSKVRDDENNTEIVTFATSVPMSTYLACFVICNFDHKETIINANGIGKDFTLRSFAQRDQTHKIDFAQDIGKRATEFYIKYYEVPFPLPKLDMIAIPDYVSGATEHWGLITYRETSFLVDESIASTRNKIGVANTIAHELAHMWFGNLVTMKWWDEVWLNEGFASYMQVKCLDAIQPSWTMLDQFLINTLHSVLVTDAKLSSHPIVQTVATPDQITAIFDSISYNKGASVLRMLEGFIGIENFRRGVSDYLKKYEFGNTITQDLLSSLEPYFRKDNPELDVKYIMDTWTKQMGYPVLTVSKGETPNTYVITQSRFLIDPDAVYQNDTEFNYRWFIPITYTTNQGADHGIVWFPDSSERVIITLNSDEDWIKLNNNQVGYYRVNYKTNMWHNLIQQLKNMSGQLTISDRAHLLDDVFALAESRKLSYELAMELSTYLKVEKDYVPWVTAARIFSVLAERLLNSAAYDNLKIYVQRLVEPLYQEQTWDDTNKDVIKGLLRHAILSISTKYGLPDAETKVKSLFTNWLNTHGSSEESSIDPDLRDFVYVYGMRSATQSEWDKLWQIYVKEEDVQEQSKIRNALAAPRNVDILSRYLELAWDEKNIRSQDYLGVLQTISGNPHGTALVWNYLRSHWPALVDRFTLNSRYLGNVVPVVTSNFNTEAQVNELLVFFEQYPEAGAGESSRRRALETVRNNIVWTTTQQPAVSAWLQKQL